ncbi:MAG: ATP-binding protein [Candidatus Cyclobacteriaceae bacterium M2_1C_046]
MKLDIDKLDFEHCEDEPIHIPESIQGYGYLFAISHQDGKIKIISENVEGLIRSTEPIIGGNFFEYLANDDEIDFLKETFQRSQKQKTRLPVHLTFNEKNLSKEHDTGFYAVVYDSNDLFIIELEPATEFRETYSASHYIKLYSNRIAPKFKTFNSLEEMSGEIVQTIRSITDMDRVVLYRFNEDGSGKVIAESKADDMESYNDLYYPASDIPSQAREQYKKNWVRITPNVDLESSRLIPTIEETGREPLDLTYSILRSLSPIHNQYIRNQGLKSSMSMSLVTHDKLWGLISCHSRSPKYVPQNVRLECENLSQLFSWHLYAKQEELHNQKKETTDRAINEMLDQTSAENPIVDIFQRNKQQVLDIMDADGFMFYTETQKIIIGQTPELSVVKQIYENVYGSHLNKPFISSDINEILNSNADLNGIKGVLLISLVEHKDYFTAWFRKEHKLIQRWAGRPEEKRPNSSKKERLKPRESFKVHEIEVKGKSKEWTSYDTEVAERFNKVFMSHALETQDKMLKNISDLELQNKYKNEFLATLVHELRNPLTPIVSGVSLLEEEFNSEESTTIFNMIKRQLGHLNTMIDDLMDVSRITRGKVKLVKEPLDLKEILRDAFESTKHLITEKNHNVDFDFPDKNIVVYGDNTRISQVFVNLISNAAKYTNENGSIQIKIEEVSDNASVKIIDNGLGIPPEKIHSIFSMFTQIESHSNYFKGGLGIGLTLVKKLVDLHNGQIIARSEGKNKGSEFEVILPLYKSDNK